MGAVISAIVVAILAFVGGIFTYKIFLKAKEKESLEKYKHIIENAKKEAEVIIKKAEDDAKKLYEDAKRKVEEEKERFKFELEREKDDLKRQKEELLSQKKELSEFSKKLQIREDKLEARIAHLEQKEARLDSKEDNLKKMEQKLLEKKEILSQKEEELNTRLEKIAELSREEAKKIIIKEMEEEAKIEASSILRKIEQETKEIANRRARQILTLAMQKVATDVVVSTSVEIVQLESDDMKGRIIGKEGRNIRAFEAQTGVNIIIDDTPEAVVLSCYDPFRRHIAKLALERLLKDGRIHPKTIEDMVNKVKKDVEEEIKELGEKVTEELGIYNLHPELVRLIGKLKYRTSFGQNILQHSIEAAKLAQVIAYELGIDPSTAKRAALLHDIGKAVDYEMEGTHAEIGAELAKKYGEKYVIYHAIAAHHGDLEPESLVDIITQIADAVSASRPGARREDLETYLRRLRKLEEIATSFTGVEKAYAIQAGREVRVVVCPEDIDDAKCYSLAREIKKRIENELHYPGQIQVTVIREKRVIEYAK